jgi:hypothetical protein
MTERPVDIKRLIDFMLNGLTMRSLTPAGSVF